MSELNQLLLDFNYKQNFNDHDYYVSKSNFFAFNLIDKWPKWEKKILNISGEKFSGKTHLANIFKSKASALFLNENQINDEIFNASRNILHKIQQNNYQYITDGLIYTPIDKGVGLNHAKDSPKNFKATWDYSFKWKPPEFNSIDFLVTTVKTSNKKDKINIKYNI